MSKSYSAIGLVNPKSPTNVGGVLRAAGCYGAQAVYFNGNRYAKAAKYHTDTKNIADHIPIQQVDDLISLKISGRALVCVELVEGATPLPEFQHPEDALYIFGPEDGSLPQSIVDAADAVVYVPTTGCMNLAATVNVLLYDRMAKRATSFDATQVLSSRDTNNRLIVG
ncbi:RNA methyltransferase [Pseudoalteromonas luteoviolacea]|uniref:23S rRNA methyltransferase n=1 Tax=Pseudoalteromonas luteoviolacea NCIMB 1942 TaxID=1365253 RepID=A0A167CK04_9GAMM|nr:RNA methyltransferase [Pseudoalteromonas luteoviolacea]KZN47754.1 23S rRNA methyltransferase [Pseudoalteromonas luteoviolacea NCIMB 1942]KZW99738.1 23S rRNA methyltransferase [Pseudoalteromonas luteoviolacea]